MLHVQRAGKSFVSFLFILSATIIILATSQLEKVGESMKAQTLPICQKVNIPTYFDAGSLWKQATAGSPTVGIMIMNPEIAAPVKRQVIIIAR